MNYQSANAAAAVSAAPVESQTRTASVAKSLTPQRGAAPRLVHITTVPQSLIFLEGQIGEMTRRGLDVVAISSPGEALDRFGEQELIPTYGVDMPRRVTPLRDLRAVARIYRHLRRLRPDIVHAHTPKGGLLGMIAAALARVPVRIYHIHGLPYLTASGSRRALLRVTEKIACALAHQVLCVSPSIRDVAIAQRLCMEDKIAVLANGTINGVDAVGHFNPAQFTGGRESTRHHCGIPDGALVLGFVGRIVRDKGIVELVEAWQTLRRQSHDLHLLIVGPFESHDPLPAAVTRVLRHDPRIHLTGAQRDPAPLYGAMDLVILPSYREGFPTVPLEAAAMALPVVASRVPGCIDAVQDGITGTLVPPRNSHRLAEAIRAYLHSAELRRRHGQAAREWVLKDFCRQAVWDAVHREYVRLLVQTQPKATVDAAVNHRRGSPLSTPNHRLVMAMLTVAGATGLVKLAAMVKEMLIAARYGASDDIDAFVVAFLLPSFVISVVSSAFQAAVIPAYVRLRDRDGPGAARHLISNVAMWSSALLVVLTGVLAVLAPLLLMLTASRFAADKLWLTRQLFYCLLPLVVLSGVTAIWGATLNAEAQFLFVSITPIATPLMIALTITAVGGTARIYALPAGMFAGGLIEVAVLARRVHRAGLWAMPRWRHLHPATGEVLKQFVVMAVGAALMSSTAVLDLSMAALLGPGSVATLNYANRLVLFLLGFCSVAMSTVLLPHFSAMVARQDWTAVRAALRSYLGWIAVTTVPVTAVLIWLSVPITRVMFERGAFSPDATHLVGRVQALYLLQLPFYLVSILLVRVISSLNANHLLMWGSAISVAVNASLNYVLMQWLGVAGIALSTTIVYIVSLCFLGLVLSRRLRRAASCV